MTIRIILRIMVGILFACAAFAMGYDRIEAACAANPLDVAQLAKGVGLVVLGVLMLAALVVSHRARRRLAARRKGF